MRVAVAAGPGRTALLQELDDDGTGHGRAVMVNDLPAAVAGYERAGAVRWVWADTPGSYPPLLRAGMRVDRCHDVTLVEALLRARDGSPADPPVPSAPRPPETRGTQQPALWGPAETALPEAQDALRALVTAHAGQVRRIAADPHPARFGLLAAVESAGGLAAAEMRARGMPWRADVHDALLADLLGPRPVAGVRPARLAALAKDISAAARPPADSTPASRPNRAGCGSAAIRRSCPACAVTSARSASCASGRTVSAGPHKAGCWVPRVSAGRGADGTDGSAGLPSRARSSASTRVTSWHRSTRIPARSSGG